jgi:hypothetical protein
LEGRIEGCLGATILRPGYFFLSEAYHKDAPNQRSSTLQVADKLLAPALSVFYPAVLIYVEDLHWGLLMASGKGRVV